MIDENLLNRRTLNRFRYMDEGDAQKKLWRNVVAQAIEDATTGCRKKESQEARREAIDWLLQDDVGFSEICEQAGLCPKTVRASARVFVRNYRL